MEGQFEQLELDGRPVQVVPYPTFSEVSEIEDALEDFDSLYDPNASTNSPLQKMTAIFNFISSADHFRINKYTLEYCLCGKQGCIVCAKTGRGIRTPDISIKRKNIRGELLRWMDLPVIDHIDKANLLSINKTRA